MKSKLRRKKFNKNRLTKNKKQEPKKVSKTNKKNVETIENLSSLLKEHQKNIFLLQIKIERLKELLSRKSIVRLNEKKLIRMKKNLLEAEEDYSFSTLAVDQISFRISQLS